VEGVSQLPIVETCERISKIALYILIFLMPILFLPWTANVLEFNKQALLIVAVFVASFAWILRGLISGKINLDLSWIHIPVIVLFLIYLVSTIFSLWPYGSFWGWPQTTSESLLSLLGLLLFYFLLINVFEKKEIFYVLSFFVLSVLLATIYGILQFFGKFLIPIDFTKTNSFSTVGGMNNLGIFTASLLPLIVMALVQSKKKLYRVLFLSALIVLFTFLFLINFRITWWLVIAGAVLLIAFGTQKRDVFDNRWLVLPMFFLAVALLLSFLRFQVPGIPQAPLEIFLKHKPSFDIAWQALKEKPVLGTGPGTFIYNFSKYKDISFNQGAFWDSRFDWASSKALTVLGTVGILGTLAFLILIALFAFYGIRYLFRKKVQSSLVAAENQTSGDSNYWLFGAGVFISFLVLTIGFFLYSSNISIDFLYFLMLGSFVALFSERKKEFILKPSSLITLGVTFVFTIVFIFGLGILILETQRYIASVSYLRGVKLLQNNQTDPAIKQMERSVRMAPGNDFYWRELSQLYLKEINEVNKTDLPKEEKTKQIQLYINSSVNSAKAATDTNPSNVSNWSVRGFVYQSLIGVVGGAADWAITCYDRAEELEPINPYFPTQAGISFLGKAVVSSQEEKNELMQKAKEKFEKALELKPDYSPAKTQLQKL